jgi:PII-like signaling protein
MRQPINAILLRIFISEDQVYQKRPLYEMIVLKAREMRMRGATVLRGPMGFGHSRQLRTTKILRLARGLPFVIEIVDTEEKIFDFLPLLEEMISSGVVILERVQTFEYGVGV